MQQQQQQRAVMKTYSKKQIEENVASSYCFPPPTNATTTSRLLQIDDMKLFFATATQQWEHNKQLKRFALPAGESISCVLWDDLFFITGTDIVRSLTFRFHAFGRPVTNPKKFEEGIFSDLRNLKPGHDARLEEPKSELLDMLYKNNCIRTQKKQKVFFWFSVPHDRLFLDALERDLKREKMGMEPTTQAVAEPATTISLDSTQELFDQLRKSISQSAAATAQVIEQQQEKDTSAIVTNRHHNPNWSSPTPTATQWSSRIERIASQSKRSRVNSVLNDPGQQQNKHHYHSLSHSSYLNNINKSPARPSSSRSFQRSHDVSKSSPIMYPSQDVVDPIAHGVHQLELSATKSATSQHSDSSSSSSSTSKSKAVLPSKSLDSNAMRKTKTIFGNFSLFDGSPTYKQRRRRAASVSTSALTPPIAGGPDRIRRHDKCHLRTQSNHPNTNLNVQSTSRLAMAAAKAGYIQNHPMMMPSLTWQQPVQQDYYCPIDNCRHMFKRPEHLDRHMQSLHAFVCNLCGKQFLRSENLAEHHRMEHANQALDSFQQDDHQDDDSSFDDHFHPSSSSSSFFHAGQHSMCQPHDSMIQQGIYASPRSSFDSSRSNQWSHQQDQSKPSSRCSTLSPMQDADYDMPDSQQSNESQVVSCSQDILSNHPTPFGIKLEAIETSLLPQPSSSSSSSLSSLSNGIMTMKKGSFEDDFSSSSASSPSFAFQQQQQINKMLNHDASFMNDNPKVNCSSVYAPMTLLSPFKPNYHQQMMTVNPLTDTQNLAYPSQQHLYQSTDSLEDDYMLADQLSIYAPFVNPSAYSPFTASPDMKYSFGA
ncbi:STE like transcription factor-domain-containing protein [Blakeslea trispora]|nr:STE like transcription factor-domain-containing protein [Blakeslea trispora]